MPPEPEAFAGYLSWQLGIAVTDLIERYRDSPAGHDIILADADLIEDAYRRLGDFVHLIRPKREAA